AYPASAMTVSTLGVIAETIKNTMTAANKRKSRPRGQMPVSSKSCDEKFERVIPKIAADIQPATSFTEAIPKGQCCSVRTNMHKYWIASRIMLQRQSRTIKRPVQVIKIRTTAIHE